MRKVAVIWSVVLLLGPARAGVYSPRVVSPHNADAYSLKTFGEFHLWRDLTGDERAFEVYKYLADTRTGLFHMNEVLEGNDVLSEYTTVRDPIKIINVYGYAYCAILGPIMAGICEGIGIGPSRTLTLPDWSHVAAESFYDGAWHYLDIDVRAVFRRPDGTLASMDDARRDPSLWKGPHGPLFFPNDALEKTREIYVKTPVHHYHDFFSTGHTMDFVLRQGETFTRWWKPQGGRWHHADVYNQQEWLRKLIEEEPRGPKPNHRDFTVHNYGNGRFVYHPNLRKGSTDFEDGAYDFENVCACSTGLTLVKPGSGYTVFEVRTPYIIVPVVGDLETTADECDASVVEMDAVGATVFLSLDNGMRWQEVKAESSPARLDLTPYVSGTYGYLLKIALEGRPGEALLRSLKITTWVQVAPASLPSLRKGSNRMELRTGDHYGLPTRVVEIRPKLNNPEEFFRHLWRPPTDYDPARKTERVRGEFVVKVEAPPKTRIAWFSAGGSFRTHLHAAASQTRNSIAYAVDKPEDFQVIYQADVPRHTEHWNYNADCEVRLETPAKVLYIRYVGDPAVNNVPTYAHCLDENPPRPAPVNITHTWLEDGSQRRATFSLQEPTSYEIVAGSEPEDVSVEISVPSDDGK